MDDTAFRLRKAEALRSFSLLESCVHLKELGQAAVVPVGHQFWSTIATRADLAPGRLLGTLRWEQDMATWEMHPAGDELLVALSGRFEILMQDGKSDRVVELAGGQAFLVPFGVWHRYKVQTPGEVLFVTPGKGTQYRAL